MLTPPHELQAARTCSCSGFPLISRLPGTMCGWLVFQVPSRSLKSSALTCPGYNFYRFLMFHLNPVTYDIHLHSICQLQQKSNLEWHSTLHVVHPTLGVWAWTQSSYNWNMKFVKLNLLRPLMCVIVMSPFSRHCFFQHLFQGLRSKSLSKLLNQIKNQCS